MDDRSAMIFSNAVSDFHGMVNTFSNAVASSHGPAHVMSQSVAAMAEIEGMKAENAQRAIEGKSMAYDHEAFVKVIKEYEIGVNEVVTTLRGY